MLILIEATDLVFAVDSIPAIFAITTDPFIVFTSTSSPSGLRALYFLLADGRPFPPAEIRSGAGVIFVGGKMLAAYWFHLPVQYSLAIVGTIIFGSIVLSLKLSKPQSPGRDGWYRILCCEPRCCRPDAPPDPTPDTTCGRLLNGFKPCAKFHRSRCGAPASFRHSSASPRQSRGQFRRAGCFRYAFSANRLV